MQKDKLQTVEFLEDMARELAEIAKRASLPTAKHLFEMAGLDLRREIALLDSGAKTSAHSRRQS